MKAIRSNESSRREFLRQTALGATGAALGLGLSGCQSRSESPAPKGSIVFTRNELIPVGVELYSVREECKADFPGTIAAVAKVGYKGVEFAGYWGRSAKDIRKMLDDNGLVACGTHTPYETFLPDKLEATIEFNQVIGNKFLICPSMGGSTEQDWLKNAEMFNGVAEKLRPLGMRTGYHSHQQDFKKIGGETIWDIFGGHTNPEVIMQVDTSNCAEGGADPVAVLNKYPGRVLSIHIKPFGGGPEAVIGEDKIDWAAVFLFCDTRGGTKWYVVEHETSKQPLETLKRTYDALKGLGKV